MAYGRPSYWLPGPEASGSGKITYQDTEKLGPKRDYMQAYSLETALTV